MSEPLEKRTLKNPFVPSTAAINSQKETPRIDPSTSPYTEHNQEAAERLGLKYNSKRRGYIDSDGVRVTDRFRQSLS